MKGSPFLLIVSIFIADVVSSLLVVKEQKSS